MKQHRSPLRLPQIAMPRLSGPASHGLCAKSGIRSHAAPPQLGVADCPSEALAFSVYLPLLGPFPKRFAQSYSFAITLLALTRKRFAAS